MKSLPRGTPIALLSLLAFALPLAAAADSDYRLVWADEFETDGRPDPTNVSVPSRYEIEYVRVYQKP